MFDEFMRVCVDCRMNFCMCSRVCVCPFLAAHLQLIKSTHTLTHALASTDSIVSVSTHKPTYRRRSRAYCPSCAGARPPPQPPPPTG